MTTITDIPIELIANICDYLPKRDRMNLSMVMSKDIDKQFFHIGMTKDDRGEFSARLPSACYKCCPRRREGTFKFFDFEVCKDVCQDCIRDLGNGYCYLDMLLNYRLPVLMNLGAYPDLENVRNMRVALRKSCIDDIVFVTSAWTPVTKNNVAENKLIKDKLCEPVIVHFKNQRYSYGESEFERVFSSAELAMFGDSFIDEPTIDDEIDSTLMERETQLDFEYYICGAESRSTIRDLDKERDILSSGFSAIEEANIIANFKRRLDLGIPADDAMKSSIGLDVWTIRRHGMSGVKRFIESRLCDISKSYGKKPRRKLNVAQQELLKKADEQVLLDTLYDKDFRTPSLKSSISRATLASLPEELTMPICSDKVKVVVNKRSFDAESFVTMSDLGKVIEDIGDKLNIDIDNIEKFNKQDSRLDDMIFKAGKVQGIYDELVQAGSQSKDPFKLKKSVEDINKIYNDLVDEEIISLEKYGECTKNMVEEYKKRNMFDNIPQIMRNDNIIKDINSMIDEFGDENQKTVIEKGKKEKEIHISSDKLTSKINLGNNIKKSLLAISDESDFSDPGQSSFLFKHDEFERKKEEEIVHYVEELLDNKHYNETTSSSENRITKEECIKILCFNFSIRSIDELQTLNRTKKELFLFIYKRLMFLFGFNITTKYPEDPSKSESYFTKYMSFHKEYIGDKYIVRTNTKNIRQFWKSLFGGSLTKDVYQVPNLPDRFLYEVDYEESEKQYNIQMKNYEREVSSFERHTERSKIAEEKIEQIKGKILRAEKADIPSYLKKPALSKLTNQLEDVKKQANDKPYPVFQPSYKKVYKKVDNPEWMKYSKLMTGSKRKDMIAEGWINPRLELTPSHIVKNIKNSISQGFDQDRKYRLRLNIDSKNMFRETDSNDFLLKIKILELQDVESNPDDFLKETVNMFYKCIGDNMSNKSFNMLKYIIADQETRIICSMISYFCYGYISKSFLPIRKKHRMKICESLDDLIK